MSGFGSRVGVSRVEKSDFFEKIEFLGRSLLDNRTLPPFFPLLPYSLTPLLPNPYSPIPLQRLQMTQQVGHNLWARLKSGHRWCFAADDLVDEVKVGFMAGDVAEGGADQAGGVGGVAACAVDLEDDVALDAVAAFGEDAADVGVVEAGGLDGEADDRDD
jgi:hypothetical protein